MLIEQRHEYNSHPIAPNFINLNFCFEHPNQTWLGDITYTHTVQVWLYWPL